MPPPPTIPDLSSLPASPPADCFSLHRGRVYRWAAAHGLSHHQRLDIIQDTFAKLIAVAPEFACEAAQVAWLRRVASNLAIDHRRRQSRRHTIPLTPAIPAPRLAPSLSQEVQGDAADLGPALASLSEMQRLVLLAKCVDNHTFAQVATQLDIAIPTAKTHYVRALQALRAQFAPNDPQPAANRRPAP